MTHRTAVIERAPYLDPRLVDDDEPPAPGWCQCDWPRWQLIGLFDCHQCARCGRPNLGELRAFRTRRRKEVA